VLKFKLKNVQQIYVHQIFDTVKMQNIIAQCGTILNCIVLYNNLERF